MKEYEATEQAYKNGYEAGKKSVAKTNYSLYWAVAIKNSICVICWTALAIIFHKWWIALFGALFITSIETKNKSYRVCDRCGKHSPYADSYNDALDKAKAAGWIHHADGNKDYCPECKMNF
jgi:hypothetical protein